MLDLDLDYCFAKVNFVHNYIVRFFCFRLCSQGDPAKVSISALAAKYHLPMTTLWKCLMGKVVGKGHHSGGRGAPHVLSSGK